MTEQDYRELTAAVKESGIALKMQKELQRLLDNDFFKSMTQDRQPSDQRLMQNESKEKSKYSGMYIDRSRV